MQMFYFRLCKLLDIFVCFPKQEAHQLKNAASLKLEPSEAAFSAVSSNFKKCRPERADAVVSSTAVDIGRRGCSGKIW